MNFRRLTNLTFSICLIWLFSTACSDDSSEAIQEDSIDLIIGEWKLTLVGDYECGTDAVNFETEPDIENEGKRFVFKEDGTYGDYIDGVLTEFEDQKGTWQYSGDGRYNLTYTVDGSERSTSILVDFENNSNMMLLWSDYPCDSGQQDYGKDTYQRQ